MAILTNKEGPEEEDQITIQVLTYNGVLKRSLTMAPGETFCYKSSIEPGLKIEYGVIERENEI